MFGKKRVDNGEKVYRYSIRKYHFGAASVAVASLLFFGNGAVQAAENAPAATNGLHQIADGGGGDSSGDSGSTGNLNDPATTTNSTSETATHTTAGISTETTSAEKSVASDSSKRSENTDSTTSNVSEKNKTSIEKVQDDATSTEAKKAEEASQTGTDRSATGDAKKAQEASQTGTDRSATGDAKKAQEASQTGTDRSATEDAKKAEEASQTGTDRSAATESSNRGKPTPPRRPQGRRVRPTEVQPGNNTTSNGEEGTSNKETAPKQLPTYTNNATDNYALAEEMRKMVKRLQDNGADAAKVAAIKANYDKLNEKLGLVDKNGVLSEEDFAAATANLKAARDFTEAFLHEKDKNEQPSTIQPRSNTTGWSGFRSIPPGAARTLRERSADDRVVDRGFPNASTAPYATAKEFYYEDGQKGSSPYDKYTYLFHTFTESLVANNRTHSPVKDVKRLVYEEVNEVEGGYLWTITFNDAHEDQHDGYAFFSIPNGQIVDNSSITIEKTPQAGVAEEVAGAGDLGSRVRTTLFNGAQIGIRKNGADENTLEGLARGTANVGYYTRRLEESAGEMPKSNDMFEKNC